MLTPLYRLECTGSAKELRKAVQDAERQFALLPDDIYKRFRADGWRLIITTDDLAHRYYQDKFEFVQGATIYREKTIYVDRDSVSDALLHEFGHYVYSCLSEEKQILWIQTAIDYESDFCKNFNFEHDAMTPGEICAESFSVYLTNRPDLLRICPVMVRALDSIVEEIIENN